MQNLPGLYQFWTSIKEKYSFCEKCNIATSLSEICYHEKMIDDDEIFGCDLWFYGDLPSV